jgi:hypothetical protein
MYFWFLSRFVSFVRGRAGLVWTICFIVAAGLLLGLALSKL